MQDPGRSKVVWSRILICSCRLNSPNKGVGKMAKDTLTDLNTHLFAQIERLGDEDVKGDDLIEEIGRAQAVTSVAREIVSNASLVLKAQVAVSNSISGSLKPPKMLSVEE